LKLQNDKDIHKLQEINTKIDCYSNPNRAARAHGTFL